jgi:hypothetical protein
MKRLETVKNIHGNSHAEHSNTLERIVENVHGTVKIEIITLFIYEKILKYKQLLKSPFKFFFDITHIVNTSVVG